MSGVTIHERILMGQVLSDTLHEVRSAEHEQWKKVQAARKKGERWEQRLREKVGRELVLLEHQVKKTQERIDYLVREYELKR